MARCPAHGNRIQLNPSRAVNLFGATPQPDCRRTVLRWPTERHHRLRGGCTEVLVAGLNAARQVQGQEPVLFPREGSYIGTMIDDLITKDLREPYRVLTSRS